MFRIFILALLIATPAFAQDQAKPPTIVVQPAPVVVREIPPALVNAAPWPRSIEVVQPPAGWFERYQTLIAGLVALLAGGAGAVAAWNAGRQAFRGAVASARATHRSTLHMI